MKLLKKIGSFFKSYLVGAYSAFDKEDFFLLCGGGMLYRGLYLKWGEWLAMLICGSLILLMATASLLRGKQ